jgi:hypothetical protein
MDSKPLSNNTQPLPSPSTTDWQLPRRRNEIVLVHISLSLSLSLHIFYLSLDVGFCDDIPLMAARFFLQIYSFSNPHLQVSRLYGKEMATKTHVGWVHGRGKGGVKEEGKIRRNTRMSKIFFTRSLLFCHHFFWFVGCEMRWERRKGGNKKVLVQWDLFLAVKEIARFLGFAAMGKMKNL